MPLGTRGVAPPAPAAATAAVAGSARCSAAWTIASETALLSMSVAMMLPAMVHMSAWLACLQAMAPQPALEHYPIQI